MKVVPKILSEAEHYLKVHGHKSLEEDKGRYPLASQTLMEFFSSLKKLFCLRNI